MDKKGIYYARPFNEKSCTTCKEKLAASPANFGFARHNRDGLNGSCKACIREYNRVRYNEGKQLW
jgi:hypothetical protein